jgi:hypothetical protein
MLGLNTTGRPDKRDYLLGRACVFVSELDSTTGLPTCYRPLGNTPALTVSVEVEELTHRASFCSKFGGAVIDRRLIIQQTLNLSMTLEELNHENVAIFFSGSTDNPANPAVAGIAEYELTDNLALNCWYPIMDGSNIRALGIDKTKVTVEEGVTALTEGVEGVGDYEVCEEMGLIIFYGTGPNTLAGGETIDVTLAADAAAPAEIEQVLALTTSQRTFAVKAIIENANNGDEQLEMEFHSVALIGDGELSPIGDELATVTLAGVAESNSNLSGSPTLTISKAVG